VFDPAAPVWLAKANFVMLMLHEQVAALKTRYADEGKTLYLRTPDGHERAFALDDAEGRSALGEFFLGYLPKRLTAPPRLVEALGHQFTDKAEKYVSLINLASLRELEKRWDVSLDPLRFRANIYIDGAEAFRELDWVGREIRLGGTFAEVTQRNGRCAATNVNPVTGVRDRDVPGRLRTEFGHKDLGVYLKIRHAGVLKMGDPVEVEPGVGADRYAGSSTVEGANLLICAACYYLFDPRKINAAWSTAADLPERYRCPDCGAGRDAAVPAGSFKPTA
jgi:GntR family transcriptional regulator/MocR family aminotransferase